MKDHLIRFNSEAEAVAALPQYRVETEEGSAWRGDITVPGVVVYENDVALPYWYILIALPEQSAALTAIPTCMIVADREATIAAGHPVVLHSAIPVEAWSLYRAEPMPAGSNYPFGVSE